MVGVQDLIKGMLRPKVDSRLSMAQVLQHPWLAGCGLPQPPQQHAFACGGGGGGGGGSSGGGGNAATGDVVCADAVFTGCPPEIDWSLAPPYQGSNGPDFGAAAADRVFDFDEDDEMWLGDS